MRHSSIRGTYAPERHRFLRPVCLAVHVVARSILRRPVVERRFAGREVGKTDADSSIGNRAGAFRNAVLGGTQHRTGNLRGLFQQVASWNCAADQLRRIKPFVMMGQASLQVFCAHLLFCFIGLAIMREEPMVNGWQEAALVAMALSGMLLTAQIFSRKRSLPRHAQVTTRAVPQFGD
ncbi:MAG: hypothetical protein DMG81_02070 [Acidobacteria bacterium]|nr:MAG: hypothetical protein DMG81_02070 [Acidobacteriota bacterium]